MFEMRVAAEREMLFWNETDIFRYAEKMNTPFYIMTIKRENNTI